MVRDAPGTSVGEAEADAFAPFLILGVFGGFGARGELSLLQ